MVCMVLAALGCAGQPTPETARKALDAMSDEQRQHTFTATTAALDQRPEYVDELYVVVRQHPPTFHRVLVNATGDLDEQPVADQTAKLLVDRLPALEQVMLSTLDNAKSDPGARAVLAKAIVERRYVVADILTEYPDDLVKVMNAAMEATARKHRAQVGLRTSMRQSADTIAPILIQDPETLATLMRAMLRAGLTPEAVLKTLEELKDEPAK